MNIVYRITNFHFQYSDTVSDPVKNRPDPQHWFQLKHNVAKESEYRYRLLISKYRNIGYQI
jgi:arabinogalactan endo-1,4-beta-galactosidase